MIAYDSINSEDFDEKLQVMTSHLGLYCFLMSHIYGMLGTCFIYGSVVEVMVKLHKLSNHLQYRGLRKGLFINLCLAEPIFIYF